MLLDCVMTCSSHSNVNVMLMLRNLKYVFYYFQTKMRQNPVLFNTGISKFDIFLQFIMERLI